MEVDAKEVQLTENLPSVYSLGVCISRCERAKGESLHTNVIFKLILMTSPPGVGAPGCNSGFSKYQSQAPHPEVTYNGSRAERLGETILVQ